MIKDKEAAIAQIIEESERAQTALNEAELLLAYISARYVGSQMKRHIRRLRNRWKYLISCPKVRFESYNTVRNSSLFDQNYYLAANPDVKAMRIDPVVHYLRFGSLEGRSPSPYFSESRYRELYPDVASHAISAVEHYERYGRNERRLLFDRSPCLEGCHVVRPDAATLLRSVERSGLFDPTAYLKMHEDVRQTGVDPWKHFVEAGFWEGRRFTTPELVAHAISRSASDIRDASSDVTNRLVVDTGVLDIQRAAFPLLSRGAKIGVFCNSHGNFFMQEIADLMHWQLKDLYVDSHPRTEDSELLEPFDIRVFVAPHEFFWLGRGENWRSLAGAPGSVLFNVEQVQTNWFCRGFPFLVQAPLVLDINFQSAVLLRKMGCKAIHYMPPYLNGCKYTSPQVDVSYIEVLRGYEFSRQPFDWEKHNFMDRPIDILFVGTGCERRLKVMESLRDLTDKYRFVCVYTHQDSPLTGQNYRTTSPEINCALAQRSKIVLSIHRDWIGYFEWSRMVMQGFWQGACVVSDPSFSDPVFVSGTHFLEESARHLPDLLHWLLDTPDGQVKMEEIAAAGHRQATSSAARAAMLAPMLMELDELSNQEAIR